MRRIGRWVLNALTVLSLVLCVAGTAIWLDRRVLMRPDTIIRTGMELELLVNDVPTAPRTFLTVDLSGRIDLPLMGKMLARGLTSDDLAADINHAFDRRGSNGRFRISVRIVGFQPPGPLVICLLLTIPALRVLCYCWVSWKKTRRLSAGLCTSCSYDLTGNVSGVCPECGMAIGKVS